ncbi:2-keto-4-pentenoate hydratase/2-oxohepta-3-ene-1,7-dioic acid hydratase in catechol pathway [Silvimonas terrae]|uniref:2-keto-4-pentenoate hydratase/2-oxohepta-3-ene-1,7-dioic acid hydratase in catechol pathway n=1 Tax=Silvimonas terrae TaxID=300266 RepID=A0A840REP8_9NEIS|nr:fumarylacetoacetate hydrolase family protein [Silvimonas terrae]MBB5190823.1 2-keto-4-pentenoate hydratase/2-oxohepta-3-ene-1,7-dioic acid hydratase in catechol pathway [Silvimonas terrae]
MPQIQIADQILNVANLFCVGRNFAAHAAEMGSSIGEEPMVFLKPTSAILPAGEPIPLPSWSREIHHETELVVAIGKGGRNIDPAHAMAHVAGYALGLDLTARDVQAEAKKKGQPWTLAKGYYGAAVLTGFVPVTAIADPAQLTFTLHIDGELRQHADTRNMVFNIPTLIAWISSRFGLTEGDLIYTGTPEGVGPIQAGETLQLVLPGLIDQSFVVAK